MKSSLKTKRINTTDRYYAEHFEELAHRLAKPIIEKYKKRCIKQGAPLGYFGKKRIDEYVLKKMIVTATVKVTMKELDALFPEES